MSLEGQQLGRYHLKQLIGSGGMGEVYLAQDPGINRQVAIKVVRIDPAAHVRTNIGTLPGMKSVSGVGTLGSQDAARMFQREAKAIAMLDHPAILPLYDYGEQIINGVLLTFLVMPYREEGSLANWLQNGGFKLLTAQSLELMLQQAAAALQYAHDHQVVHQDVKPSNFLIRASREHPKRPDLLLTDFGIAKLSMLASRASQSIRGTPTYMAPEQWEGHPVPSTDQYALAVMLFELLTSRPPFRGTPMQMMYAHVNTQPQAPSALNPRLSSAIDTVILRGLAKKPEQRFPSIIAFAFAFRQALRSIDPSISIGVSNPDLTNSDKSPITLGNNAFNASATLAINEVEARNGTNRNLKLPGGRQVRVRIPAGVKDGQIIRILDQGEQAGIGSTIRVYLTVSIARSTSSQANLLLDESAAKYNKHATHFGGEKAALQTESTVTVKEETKSPHSTSNMSSRLQVTGESISTLDSLPVRTNTELSPNNSKQSSIGLRRRTSRAYITFIALLVSLLVVSSVGFFYYLEGHHSTTTPSASEGAEMFASVTAQTRATVVARSGTTATVSARKGVTATANAVGANLYPPYEGSLVLNDPMIDNNQGHHWQVSSGGATGNSCKFVDGAYHVIDAPQNAGVCFATATNFSNFTYQIEMMFIKAGQSFDGGGITIQGSGNNYYYFEVFESGRYKFVLCTGNDCNHTLTGSLSQAIPAFHIGLFQTNTIAIVVKGNNFDLYVNGAHIAGPVSDPDNTSSHGMIGVFGAANDATTEIVYKDAKVWK
jgi:eukaryotic-like serine/threonine-protein kinase